MSNKKLEQKILTEELLNPVEPEPKKKINFKGVARKIANFPNDMEKALKDVERFLH